MDPKKTLIPLRFDYNLVEDVMVIEGIRYSGDLFREFSENGMPTNTLFKIEKREKDGVLIVRRMDNTRIKIGPLEMTCKKCGEKDTFTLDLENPNGKA